MEENKRRYLAAPLILILVGVALLLRQLGIWSFSWTYVWRLWPLLLVVFGLDILLSGTRLGGLVFLLLTTGIIVLAFVLLPPSEVGQRGAYSESFEYPSKGVHAVTLYLQMGVGTVELSSDIDEDKLVEATIAYDEQGMRPTSEFTLEGGDAIVRIKSAHSTGTPFGGSAAGEWIVKINPSIPVQLKITAGVNKTDFDLGDITLESLDLDMGVGDVDIQLPQKGPYEVDIDGGVGMLTLDIPPGVEARIRIDGGIGSIDVSNRYHKKGKYYLTDGFEGAKDAADIDIDGGVGSITIR